MSLAVWSEGGRHMAGERRVDGCRKTLVEWVARVGQDDPPGRLGSICLGCSGVQAQAVLCLFFDIRGRIEAERVGPSGSTAALLPCKLPDVMDGAHSVPWRADKPYSRELLRGTGFLPNIYIHKTWNGYIWVCGLSPVHGQRSNNKRPRQRRPSERKPTRLLKPQSHQTFAGLSDIFTTLSQMRERALSTDGPAEL